MQESSLSLFLSGCAFVISTASTLGKDWLQERFGWTGRAKLQIEVEKADSHHMHGWIEGATAMTQQEHWRGRPEDETGRIRAHFYRAKITNVGIVPARQISVWIKRFECRDPSSEKKPLENIIPLRWSDFWRFETDIQRKKVGGGKAEITFPLLPEKCSKYCDLCFHLSYDGPPEVGGLKRDRAYFAVLNLPSSSYSIDGNSQYRVVLHITAENARPLEATIEVTTDFNARSAVRMTLAGNHH